MSVGTASAMRNEDVLLPSYRDNAALIWRGIKPWIDLAGFGSAMSGAIASPGQFRSFRFAFRSDRRPPTLRASPTPSSRPKEPRVAVCLFGDGATSRGELWEAMNFAGVHKLPVVFVATK